MKKKLDAFQKPNMCSPFPLSHSFIWTQYKECHTLCKPFPTIIKPEIMCDFFLPMYLFAFDYASIASSIATSNSTYNVYDNVDPIANL
jgi:hypothetical protein